MSATRNARGTVTKVSRIPEFSSIQEEAEWWDTHDITDYLDELTPVKMRVAKKLSETITIHVDTPTFSELERIAREQGINVQALAFLWVYERLQQQQQSAVPAE